MNLAKLKEILSLSEDPLWMTRNPDTQRVAAPETPPLPKLPGQQEPKPQPINQKAMQRAADQMLFGSPDTSPRTEPSANPISEGGAGPTLSDNIKTRKLMRQQNPSFPGKIGIAQGGY